MQKWHHKQSKKYISKISVGREWSVACNRPTLACPRIIAAAIAAGGLCRPQCLYDVTTIPESVCIVSPIKVLLIYRMSTASCDTLWHDTDAISINIAIRRPCVAAAGSSVSQRSPSPKQSNGLNGPCVLRRIHTMRRRFGDRSAGGSVRSPSQLDRARTRDRVGSGIISGT